jgi:hypothetical protein
MSGLSNRNLLPMVLESGKSKIEVPLGFNCLLAVVPHGGEIERKEEI